MTRGRCSWVFKKLWQEPDRHTAVEKPVSKKNGLGDLTRTGLEWKMSPSLLAWFVRRTTLLIRSARSEDGTPRTLLSSQLLEEEKTWRDQVPEEYDAVYTFIRSGPWCLFILTIVFSPP